MMEGGGPALKGWPDPQSGSHAAASDLWRHTLSQIPTVFGRLVYLAALRDPNTGRYQHFGLAQKYGEQEADRTLRESHQQVFQHWLSFSLEEQKADLERYLAQLGQDLREVLKTWTSVAPYRSLPPVTAREHERRLYLADFEAILDLLRSAYGVACPDPDA